MAQVGSLWSLPGWRSRNRPLLPAQLRGSLHVRCTPVSPKAGQPVPPSHQQEELAPLRQRRWPLSPGRSVELHSHVPTVRRDSQDLAPTNPDQAPLHPADQLATLRPTSDKSPAQVIPRSIPPVAAKRTRRKVSKLTTEMTPRSCVSSSGPNSASHSSRLALLQRTWPISNARRGFTLSRTRPVRPGHDERVTEA